MHAMMAFDCASHAHVIHIHNVLRVYVNSLPTPQHTHTCDHCRLGCTPAIQNPSTPPPPDHPTFRRTLQLERQRARVERQRLVACWAAVRPAQGQAWTGRMSRARSCSMRCRRWGARGEMPVDDGSRSAAGARLGPPCNCAPVVPTGACWPERLQRVGARTSTALPKLAHARTCGQQPRGQVDWKAPRPLSEFFSKFGPPPKQKHLMARLKNNTYYYRCAYPLRCSPGWPCRSAPPCHGIPPRVPSARLPPCLDCQPTRSKTRAAQGKLPGHLRALLPAVVPAESNGAPGVPDHHAGVAHMQRPIRDVAQVSRREEGGGGGVRPR